MPSLQIFVATHRPYPMPSDAVYSPIQVGRAISDLDLPFIPDNTGDHISDRNPRFCELTALYWAWKNSSADYIGLVHYRRHFRSTLHTSKLSASLLPSDITNDKSTAKTRRRLARVASSPEILQLLQSSHIILPTKRHYMIENLFDHYTHTLNPEPLFKVRHIIAERTPTCLPEFDRLHTRRSAHMFNMFIIRRDLLDQYCNWLFPILFELEASVNVSTWGSFDQRYVGRVSELLLDVWLYTHHLDYTELSMLSTARTNWLRKGGCFLMSKFCGRKYAQSF